MTAGKLFVISGPSGVGKGEIIKKLLAAEPKLHFSVSATTRAPRPNDVEGETYYFISKAEFQAWLDQGRMLEWAEYEGEYYGTPAAKVEEKLQSGYDVLLDIETLGMSSLRKQRPDAVTMFVLPPSFAELERRLRYRNTETEEKILSRLKKGQEECAMAPQYDYQIINKELNAAVKEIQAVIHAERSGTAKRLEQIKGEF